MDIFPSFSFIDETSSLIYFFSLHREVAARYNQGNVNTNIYMTNRRNGGTIGTAYLGSVCDSNIRYRTNINTYFYLTGVQNGYVSDNNARWVAVS